MGRQYFIILPNPASQWEAMFLIILKNPASQWEASGHVFNHSPKSGQPMGGLNSLTFHNKCCLLGQNVHKDQTLLRNSNLS